jgi:predicted ATPase
MRSAPSRWGRSRSAAAPSPSRPSASCGSTRRRPASPARLETPLIGREAELEQIRGAFAAAQEERRCAVLRIVGEPGIGKTRLANEVATELAGRATILSARCPSYGTGATWLPLLEIVAELGGVDALGELLAAEDDGGLVVRRIGELAGLAEGTGSSGEAFWAVRRLLEALACERPLVLVLEDLHAAEPTFLDALEYLEQRVAGAALLVVATGRPELLEVRPDWHGPALTLAPLDDAGRRAARRPRSRSGCRRLRAGSGRANGGGESALRRAVARLRNGDG